MPSTGLLAQIALIFTTDEDFSVQLDRTLKVVGSGLSVSRSYLFIDAPDGSSTTNTHEWCAEGIEPQRDNLRDVPYGSMPSLKGILANAEVNAFPDVCDMPQDLRAVLEPQGIRSVILAALNAGPTVHGFLGFDECTRTRSWSEDEIETLRSIVGIVSTAYSRKLITDQLAASEHNFRSFFNTVDDIIVVGDLDGNLVFANEGASRRLGYSLPELRGKPILDLHPPDTRDEAKRILESMFRREQEHCPLELSARNGDRIPVETRIWFGQWSGQECIFGVSKDLSAEQAALQKFERLFEGNPAAMAVSRTTDGRFIDVNESFLQLLGYERHEVIGKSSSELDLFFDDQRHHAAREELRLTGAIRNRELSVRKRDGGLVCGQFSGDVIRSQGEEYFLTVMIDTTEQVRLRHALDAERTRLTNIVEGTRLGTWEWDIVSGETIFNERWAQIVGHSLDELSPTTIDTWVALTHPDDLAESDRQLQLHFAGDAPYYECECRMRHKDGSWVWVLDRGLVIERDADGRPLKMYGTHTDITEKRELEEQIRELAIRDPLTGAYNRRYLLGRVDELVSEYKRTDHTFCMSMIDIDHFKTVNDDHGHLTGDAVLQAFAGVVASMIRPYDLVGRYGGEEFIIVSAATGISEALALVERIREAVSHRQFEINGTTIRLTFSCGVADSAEFARDVISTEQMIGLADARLYAAKASGRDRCVAE